MISLYKLENSYTKPDGNYKTVELRGLSTDTKPTEIGEGKIDNGSVIGYDGLSKVSITTNVAGGGGDLDWSAIGYDSVPQGIVDGYNYALEIKTNWDGTATTFSRKFQYDRNIIFMPLVNTSNATHMTSMFDGCFNLMVIPLLNTSNVQGMASMFQYCYGLNEVPLLDTSNVTNMSSMFSGCEILKTLPLLNTSKVTNMQGMFYGCLQLTNESLDNILRMCINAISYTGTKTLSTLGFNSNNYPVSRIEALPHYQDFIDAGWTIGY